VALTFRKNAASSLTATTRAKDAGTAVVPGRTLTAQVSLFGRAVAIGDSATTMRADTVVVDLTAIEASMEKNASAGAAGGLGFDDSVNNFLTHH